MCNYFTAYLAAIFRKGLTIISQCTPTICHPGHLEDSTTEAVNRMTWKNQQEEKKKRFYTICSLYLKFEHIPHILGNHRTFNKTYYIRGEEELEKKNKKKNKKSKKNMKKKNKKNKKKKEKEKEEGE